MAYSSVQQHGTDQELTGAWILPALAGQRLLFYWLQAFDWLVKPIAVIWLIVVGDWLTLLYGFVAMFLSGVAFFWLLTPWVQICALSRFLPAIVGGLRRRRALVLFQGVHIYAGQVLAIWCMLAYHLFARNAPPGQFSVDLLWAYAVALGPLRATDRILPGLSILTHFARLGFVLVIGLHYLLVDTFWLITVLLSLCMLAGALFTSYTFSRAGQRLLNSSMVKPDLDPLIDSPTTSPKGDRPGLTIFALTSPAGTEFRQQISAIAKRLGYQVTVLKNPTQTAVWDACYSDDAVVFDATIEEGEKNNFEAALYAIRFGYVISASRSYLPVNFPDLDAVAPIYPNRWNNRTLLPQVEDRLKQLREHLPRPPEHQGFDNFDALIEQALELEKNRRKQTFGVFVSYRGKYEAELAALAQQYRANSADKMKFFRAGELALDNELLSLQRRWEVLRKIRNWISSADEIWIYNTGDYLESWWTRAELLLIAALSPSKRPRIREYDPKIRQLRPVSSEQVPILSARQEEHMWKLLFFAEQPEYAVRLREARRFKLLGSVLGLNDPVLDQSYTDDLLFQCPRCASHVGKETSFDAEGILSLTDPPLQPIIGSALNQAIKTGSIIHCGACSAPYQLVSALPHYRWYPMREGLGTGPDGTCLEKLPAYRVMPVGDFIDNPD